MLLILEKTAKRNDVEQLIDKLKWMGFTARVSGKEGDYVVAVVKGLDESVKPDLFQDLPFVEETRAFKTPFKLASRKFKRERTIIKIQDVEIGGDTPVMMVGPCAIESEEQIEAAAAFLSKKGVRVLRGGAFKPRTSPYSFQGLGEEGLKLMQAAAQRHGMITISEVMSIEQIEVVCKYIDILQVGARNMQNFSLLKELGMTKKPIFLKRGPSSTYQDLLMSAEYILERGNEEVMLCERGIRTFETYSRNTLDLNAVPILHHLSHLPVIVDPSHGTGIRYMVVPMARAALAAGADGLMIEVHPHPDQALSDKEQALSFDDFEGLLESS